jgi:hypothetical protein
MFKYLQYLWDKRYPGTDELLFCFGFISINLFVLVLFFLYAVPALIITSGKLIAWFTGGHIVGWSGLSAIIKY